MAQTHTIMVVNTKKMTANVRHWEGSDNTPLGEFLNEITRGGGRHFSDSDGKGLWVRIERQKGHEFTFEFGEPGV